MYDEDGLCRGRIEPILEVPAPLYCPDCERRTKRDHRERQWQTDIPPIEPVTAEFRVDVGRCVECGGDEQPFVGARGNPELDVLSAAAGKLHFDSLQRDHAANLTSCGECLVSEVGINW